MSRAGTSARQAVTALAAILCVLIAGTSAAVKLTADHLLYRNATAAAQNWARYLADNVADLEQIADGEQPSTASMTFFRTVQRSGVVFRYEIFNRHGFSQLVSDQEKIAPVELSEFSPDAARSLAGGQPVVDVREGGVPDLPAYFAQAYVPVVVDGRPIAIVAAYVDETKQRDELYSTFTLTAIFLCGLTTLSFVIPAIAWYRRTKEKQRADRRIHFLAHHDALTGVANRAHVSERLESLLARLSDEPPGLAVHLIDVDRFKDVNDTFGHDGGDFVLKTIAERLSAATRMNDIVARLGGDEFLIIQSAAPDRRAAEDLAERLLSLVSEPVTFRQQEIRPTITIGVALAPADGRTPDRILKSADLALYAGKRAGRNCLRTFALEMDTELQARLRLEKIVRDAVAADQFELHYQPIFEVDGHRLVGFEALLRLRGPDGGLISPAAFIPLAEEIWLIGRIGAFVLREACATAASWPDDLTVAVNLSPLQFEGGSISDIVARVLAETGLAAWRLELEITESLLLRMNDRTMAEVKKLKALGVAIVMDDFGTGYSGLSYLWQFPFDKIKIDSSFMQGVNEGRADAVAVVRTIIALGRELRMRVAVEGVETAQQSALIAETEADQVQGFYFGRPVAATELAPLIMRTLPGGQPSAAKEVTAKVLRLRPAADG
jgi:diguanylate cyclase (GGDEF)-like protein